MDFYKYFSILKINILYLLIFLIDEIVFFYNRKVVLCFLWYFVYYLINVFIVEVEIEINGVILFEKNDVV